MDTKLKNLFYKLGVCISNHTGYFLVVPILLAMFLATGIQRIKTSSDPEYLFTPIDGPAKEYRAIVKEFFKTNYSGWYQPDRDTGFSKSAITLITEKNGGNLLTVKAFAEIVELDKIIRNISISHQDLVFRFQDLCTKWEDECSGNDVLVINDFIDKLEEREKYLLNPFYFYTKKRTKFLIPFMFGGVESNNLTRVLSVKATKLAYMMRNQNPLDSLR